MNKTGEDEKRIEKIWLHTFYVEYLWYLRVDRNLKVGLWLMLRPGNSLTRQPRPKIRSEVDGQGEWLWIESSRAVNDLFTCCSRTRGNTSADTQRVPRVCVVRGQSSKSCWYRQTSKVESWWPNEKRKRRRMGEGTCTEYDGGVNLNALVFFLIFTDRRASEVDGAVEHHRNSSRIFPTSTWKDTNWPWISVGLLVFFLILFPRWW